MASVVTGGKATPRASATPALGDVRLRSLDGIRGLAILAVFGYHSTVPGFDGGWLGVEMFFVLSGYLITSLLLREHARTGHIALRRFWTRRLLRLWPALLVMVVVVAPLWRLGPFAFSSFGAYIEAVVQVVLYVWDIGLTYFGADAGFIGHTWSLAIEMYFHLLWPGLLIVILRRKRQLVVPVLLGLALASVAGTCVHFAAGAGPLAYYSPYTQALPLLVGCLLGAMTHDGLLPVGRLRWGSGLAGAGMAGLVAAVLGAGRIDDAAGFYLPLLLATAGTWLLLLGLAINPRCAAATVLSWRPLAGQGTVSYSFYLYQSPVIFTIGAYILPQAPQAVRVIAMLAIATGLAVGSYRLVERRGLRLKARFEPLGPAATTAHP